MYFRIVLVLRVLNLILGFRCTTVSPKNNDSRNLTGISAGAEGGGGRAGGTVDATRRHEQGAAHGHGGRVCVRIQGVAIRL